MAHLKILPGCRLAAELSVDDDDHHHHRRYRYGSGSGLRTDLHPLVGLADKKKVQSFWNREKRLRGASGKVSHTAGDSHLSPLTPHPHLSLQQGAPPTLTSASTNHTCLPSHLQSVSPFWWRQELQKNCTQHPTLRVSRQPTDQGDAAPVMMSWEVMMSEAGGGEEQAPESWWPLLVRLLLVLIMLQCGRV